MKIKYCFLCYKGISSLGTHLRFNHKDYTIKEYYDKFLKTEEDGVCLNCKNVTPFNEYKLKYNTYCCNYCMKHSDIYKQRCANGVSKVWNLRTTKQKQEIGQKILSTFKENPNYETIKRNGIKNIYKDKTDIEIEKIKHKRLNSLKTTWENKTDEENLEMQKKTRITKKKKYNDETYNNRKQAKETCLAKYGSEYWSSSDVGRKYISKSLLNMNTENKNKWINNVKKSLENRTKEEIELSNKKRLETLKCRTDEQKEKTNIKYKTTWSLKTKEELHTIHNKQLKNRRTYKYKYFGISFHSYDEMSFYIYNVECENKLVYRNEGDFCLPYEFNNKMYFYYPDFIIDNKIIEIKGLQFFKEKNPNNVMICPYHKKDDTLETIENRNKKAESKHQCMLKNNVEIITDCSRYMQYTKSKYGNKVVIGE